MLVLSRHCVIPCYPAATASTISIMSQRVEVRWWPLWWLMEGQDPKCHVPGVTTYGTVTDPAISPFHIRTSSVNRTHNLKK